MRSEQSWTREDKQPLHSHPKSRLKPEMEMQRDEWAEGKKKNETKENTSNKRPETDRQIASQTEMACRELYHSAIHSSVPQLGYRLT